MPGILIKTNRHEEALSRSPEARRVSGIQRNMLRSALDRGLCRSAAARRFAAVGEEQCALSRSLEGRGKASGIQRNMLRSALDRGLCLWAPALRFAAAGEEECALRNQPRFSGNMAQNSGSKRSAAFVRISVRPLR